MKVTTVVGTRPEIIRLSSTIKLLDDAVDHTLIHTGQNWDVTLNANIFRDLDLRDPDKLISSPFESPFQTVGEIMVYLHKTFETSKPDVVLILGDTNSALGAAYAAKRLGIPLIHCEAGNRCWDDRVPEETNRKMVDSLATLNLVYTEHQRTNLLQEGYHPSKILKTGSPLKEVLADRGMFDRALPTPEKLGFAVSIHREENLANGIDWLLGLLHRLPNATVTTHPRLRALLSPAILSAKILEHVKWAEPITPRRWWEMQRDATCVISDSGTVSEESYYLKFPAINVRESNERPEATEIGIAPRSSDANIMKQIEGYRHPTSVIPDYEIDNFSQRVLTAINNLL